MLTILRIAALNLNRQKKRSFLLGGAIAFGVMVITLVNGFAGGFVDNIRENMSQLFAGHLFIQGYEKPESGRVIKMIRDDSSLQNLLDSYELPARSITYRSEIEGAAIIFAGESIVQTIVGMDWDTADVLRERLVLREGSVQALLDEPAGLLLNEKTAEQLDLAVGDSMLVQGQTVTGQQNVSEFLLVGTIVDSGLFSGFAAYAHLDYVNVFKNMEVGSYTTFGVLLEDMETMDSESDKFYEELTDNLNMLPRTEGGDGFRDLNKELIQSEWQGTRFHLSTINDFLAGIDNVARAVIIAGLVVALILFTIVAVGITNTFRMVVYERTREIGTMRALGFQRSQTRLLFLVEALLLSLSGVTAGMILAVIGRFGFGLIDFGKDTPLFIFLDDGHLSFPMAPTLVLGCIILVGVVTLIAAFFPANRAARKDPADALRQTV